VRCFAKEDVPRVADELNQLVEIIASAERTCDLANTTDQARGVRRRDRCGV
jgi:hypothetical protein